MAADDAFHFHDRLEKAGAYLDAGMLAAYEAQLQAFGNQAHDFATPEAAAGLEGEADRLAGLAAVSGEPSPLAGASPGGPRPGRIAR
jgi:hypothetical protein